MWDNCRRGTSNVKKRLYRFMATPSWAAMYPLHYCQNLPRVTSDHYPVVVEILIPELNEMRTIHVVSIGSEAAASLTPDLQDGGTRLTLDSRINFALFNSFTVLQCIPHIELSTSTML
ncbi:fatty acid amide hydrolase-like protein [Tanacetum coccineum]|uniref:Fatty acid amide hydrolase-like protein n=1 Tax=Tanacetum coccineum TaxID=301880 RepID=A0ABQ5CEC1_9ASTR